MKKLFKSLTTLLMILAMLLMFSLVVFAADSITIPIPDVPKVDISGIMESLVTLIAAFVMGLISVVLNKVRQKFGIQVSAANEAWIQSQAEHAVQYVAEIAAKKAKITNGAIKLSGNALLNTAVSLVIANVPKLSKEQGAIYVQAALARIPGLGATGDCSYVVGAQNAASCVDAPTIP
ncbi:MAG: hypothetical protein WC769_01560 [Thermodesulfovibrionales bacterium]|jgi:hypothetical protein